VGILIHDQSAYALGSVRNQLSSQGITFSPVSELNTQQKAHSCLVDNADKPLVTGSEAACYANYQIALDLQSIYGNKTYAQLSSPVRQLAAQVGKMQYQQPNSPQLPQLEAQLNKLEGPANTMFQGESLRGMLLTTYAFSHLGTLGEDTSNVIFIIAGLSALAAIALAVIIVRKSPVAAPTERQVASV
jgi:hypothetical protein